MARLVLALVFILLFCNANAHPPLYDGDKVTVNKIEYCNQLVREFGHLSQEYNSKYGVTQIPNANNWEIRFKRPGWRSNKLSIIYDQTTQEENYRGDNSKEYKHRVYCEWIFYSNTNVTFSFVVKALSPAPYTDDINPLPATVCTYPDDFDQYALCPEKN